MSARPLFEVFERTAQGIAHILRNRDVWRMAGSTSGEPFSVGQYPNPDGETVTLQFRRKRDGDGMIEFRNVKASGLASVVFGDEHILRREQLGSVSEEVDNRHGVAPVEVKFRDLFSQTDSKSTDKSAGTSVSVSVEASESIEGVASFSEKIETEAHAEITESEGSETSREQEGEESTVVPEGKRVAITETRERADGLITVTAQGKFDFNFVAGKHSGGKFVGGHNAYFDSWEQFCDVVNGDAPDNINLAKSFKEHKPWHADLWALDPLNAEVRYDVHFEGRVRRTYTVKEF